MDLVWVDGTNKEFVELCGLLDENLDELVGGAKQRTQYHAYNVRSDIHDVALIRDDGHAVGCASFKRFDASSAEVKRVFVRKDQRGRGLSRRLMLAIEERAMSQGFATLVLETGRPLEAATHLYESLGYRVIPNYGPYKDMPGSICMEKQLMQPAQEEWWELTDEERRPTGRLHRRGVEVAEGDYHTVVGIWVVDGEGRILVTLRHPDKGWGGYWECPGGAVVAGETSRLGACRELAEETGLVFPEEKFELLGSSKYRSWFTDTYRVRIDDLQPGVIGQPGEVVGYRWVDTAEIALLIKEKRMVPAMAEQYLVWREELVAF